MAIKDLQAKEAALKRVETELDRTRDDLDRSRLAAEKAGSSKFVYEGQISQLERDLNNWKEKYNKAQSEVADAEMRLARRLGGAQYSSSRFEIVGLSGLTR